MSKLKSIKVKYVALYFGDFLPDLMEMTIEEKGIYAVLCMKIYAAGGWIINKTSVLASICGISEEKFTKHFANIKRKFQEEGEYLTQKRCLHELKKAEKRMKSQSEKGKKGAKSRWDKGLIHPIPMKDSNSTGITQAMPVLQPIDETRPRTEQKRKENTNTSGNLNPLMNNILKNIKPQNTDSLLNNFQVSDSSREGDRLLLYQALSQFFSIKSNADRTCLDNICKWATIKVIEERWDAEFFYKKIITLADESKKNAKNSRWGYFLDTLRREMGYIPPSKQN